MTEETTPAFDSVLFPGGVYPSQVADGPVAEFDGEFRGFYPERGGEWRPTSSYYQEAGGRGHEAVDIYAPFAPHPLETPVLAITTGRLRCRPGSIEPNKTGNRADLEFGRESEKYSYAHLSRFEGRDRKVEKGEVIGYAGCTGNADTKGECSKCGACNINSGHVHLTYFKGGQKLNVLARSGLRLRFAGLNAQSTKTCADWTSAGQPGLKQEWTPAPPDQERTRLECRSEPNWRRGGRSPLLPKEFAPIDLRNAKLLELSRKFYGNCQARFETAAGLGNRPTGAAAEIQKFLEARLAAGIDGLTAGAATRLADMRDRIVASDGNVIGLSSDEESSRRVPGWLLRHLSVLGQMLWEVCGGRALNEYADNKAADIGDARWQAHRGIVDGAAYSVLRTLNLLECGASLGGEAWLSAVDRGCHALHLTSNASPPWGGSHSEQRILSVTFGAGSLMHATISERMKKAEQGQSPEQEDVEAAIAGYVDRLFGLAARIAEIHREAYRRQAILSNETGSANAARRAEVLRSLSNQIVGAADALKACPEAIADHKVAAALLRRMASSNAALFADLAARASQPAGTGADNPSLFMLTATIPA